MHVKSVEAKSSLAVWCESSERQMPIQVSSTTVTEAQNYGVHHQLLSCFRYKCSIGGGALDLNVCLRETLDLLQNLLSEIKDVLKDDFSNEEVPANYLPEFSLDS
ncbi:hypothetical protein TNCV_1671021 [Trichonephila clavipes]|nr:hypothetical protein TNCV_1671021 [Trichonephila clavipes]